MVSHSYHSTSTLSDCGEANSNECRWGIEIATVYVWSQQQQTRDILFNLLDSKASRPATSHTDLDGLLLLGTCVLGFYAEFRLWFSKRKLPFVSVRLLPASGLDMSGYSLSPAFQVSWCFFFISSITFNFSVYCPNYAYFLLWFYVLIC